MAASTKTHGSTSAALQAICDEGRALHVQGRLEEARERYKKVLQRDPRHALALRLLAHLAVLENQHVLAVSLLRRAVAASPRDGGVHAELGRALHLVGSTREALASFDRAVTLAPANAAGWRNRGVVLMALGQAEAAVASYDRALELGLDLADAHYHRGKALEAAGRLEEALTAYDRALARDSADPLTHNDRGAILLRLGEEEAALASFDQALALHDSHPFALVNRVTALNRLERPAEALAGAERAAALTPESPDAWVAAGEALRHLGRPDEAIHRFDRALELDPGHPVARLNRGMVRLALGQFAGGWTDYEARLRKYDPTPAFLANIPVWSGAEDPRGRRVFVYEEQGLGDTIQFARYATLLQERGATVTLSARPSLHPVLERMLPGVTLLAPPARPEVVDLHIPLLSLPLAFGTEATTIPPPVAGLTADPARRARLETGLGPRTRPRVGLVWSGNRLHNNDRNRSIAFDRLAPLLAADVDWIALQKEMAPADKAAFEACGRVAFVGEALADFGDTAALIELTDLIISVDTSVAHLAGALGRRLWLLLPHMPDFRWMFGRDDSPWYPSARLFRQPAPGDWESVIDRVSGELPAALRGR